ncbi:MAG TPA: ATPase, T2SS/T4P/T4SS family [Planctomycetota bacterium]|nr:ATPase, T2SS/T4P/T4SS family [Planctomycetota bacterium]
MNLAQARVPKVFLERIPLRFARENGVVAVEDGGTVTLAVGQMDRLWAADRVAWKLGLGRELPILQADPAGIQDLINRSYHAQAKEITAVAQELTADHESGDVVLAEDVLELDEKAPAVKLVHAMLLQAIRQRASDIHLEPGEPGLRVRFRIDGVLYDRALLRHEVQEGVTSRVKVMGRMDIAERRLPQDGGVTVRVGERRIDLRIATLPSQHGERVVLRLLDKSSGLLSLDRLGFDPGDLGRVRRVLELLHGIILVTGPTGSGKTTTLYAMLSALNSDELNILTLEDPVEYQLPGITQTQVATRKGLTFAKGLRSIVRQDPDIIMVGEIRDLETATIAIQSSLTGHLVFSTLHTNDAPSAVTRLLDLGVEPYLVASSLNAILAQRLARTLCESCKVRTPFDPDALRLRGWSPEDVGYLESLGVRETSAGKGCDQCLGTGFLGRSALFEFMVMTDELRSLLVRRASAGEIKHAALARGFRTLRKDGLRQVAQGKTTLEEVWSVTQTDLE